MMSSLLSKTLTFGSSTLSGFDERAGQFVEFTDDQRRRVYGSIIQGFRDFARLYNFTTFLLYTRLRTDLGSVRSNTGTVQG